MPMKDVEWTHPRKEQKCIGCGETIPAGVRCQTLLQKDAKKISRHYLCERCAYAATNKVLASGGEAIEITPGCFSWDKLNNKFRQWWRELMETRQHEDKLLERILRRL